MAGKKEKEIVLPPDVKQAAAAISQSPGNVIADDKKLRDLSREIKNFEDTDISKFQEYSQWDSLFSRYEELHGKIEEYVDSLTDHEYVSLQDKIEGLMENLDYCYDGFFFKYNSWVSRRIRNMEERAEKQQLTSFTVFSLFMTLLTFLLSNIVVLTKTDFTTQTVIVTNLILLLVASVVFLFIGVFFGLIKKTSQAGLIAKYIILSLLPVVIGAALIVVMVFNIGG